MKSKRINQYIRIFGIILFFYILSRIDLRELASIIKGMNLFYFLIAFVILAFSFLLGILKWRILINSQDLKIPFGILVRAYLKGLFLGVITPGKLGEFWKTKYLTKAVNISPGKAFYTVLMDRLMDVMIMVMVGTVGVINFLLLNRIEGGWLLISLILLLAVFIAYFLIKKEKTEKFLGFFLRFFVPASLKERMGSFLDEFFKGMNRLDFRLFLKLVICGFSYYSISVLFYYFLALSLGIPIAFFQLFLIIALVWLVLIIPITILGIGTREASYIFFFAILNIKIPLAVAFSALILAVTVLSVIPGAILFLKDK